MDLLPHRFLEQDLLVTAGHQITHLIILLDFHMEEATTEVITTYQILKKVGQMLMQYLYLTEEI